MLPPAAILRQISIERHVDLNLLHITRRVELEVPQNDVSRVGVRRAEMLSIDRRALLTIWPVERERLTVRGKAATVTFPISIAKIALAARCKLTHALVDKVQFSIDIAWREISDLRDF